MRVRDESLSVQMSIRLPAVHVEALNRIARANDRTLSAELRRLIRKHVEERLP